MDLEYRARLIRELHEQHQRQCLEAGHDPLLPDCGLFPRGIVNGVAKIERKHMQRRDKQRIAAALQPERFRTAATFKVQDFAIYRQDFNPELLL